MRAGIDRILVRQQSEWIACAIPAQRLIAQDGEIDLVLEAMHDVKDISCADGRENGATPQSDIEVRMFRT
jgi:hypothetical protein